MNTLVLTDLEALRKVLVDAVAEAIADAKPSAASSVGLPAHEALLTRDEVASLLKVDVRTLRRLEQEPGALPRPIVIAGRLIRWRQSDILALIENHGKTPRNLRSKRFHSPGEAGFMSATKGDPPRG